MSMFHHLSNLNREKLTIKLIPHSEKPVISLSFSRLLFLILILVVVVMQMVSATLLIYNHYRLQEETENRLTFLKRLDQVQQDNMKLRSSLDYLTQEAQLVKEELERLQKQDQRIRDLIEESEDNSYDNKSLEDLYSFSFSDTYSIDKELNYSYNGNLQDLFDSSSSHALINEAQQTIRDLKDIIPAQMEKYQELEEDVRHHQAYQAALPSLWPLKDEGDSYISSGYGYRLHPVNQTRHFHKGVDIAVWYNTPVLATGDGVVEFSGWKGGFGRTVIVDHGFGYETLYAHNQRLEVDQGEEVKRGDVIAYSGNSGYSTGPHLHYEVRKDGESLNPKDFLEGR